MFVRVPHFLLAAHARLDGPAESWDQTGEQEWPGQIGPTCLYHARVSIVIGFHAGLHVFEIIDFLNQIDDFNERIIVSFGNNLGSVHT